MAIPRATYRLQLNRDFGFDDAARIAPSLARLGVSHVYISPFLQARPGSTHGYDIVNHQRLNPEIGDEAAFHGMQEAFGTHGLRLLVDIVPNHMGVGGCDNPLWLDVLEWGQDSAFAGWFDIDWESHNRYLAGKILVPFLGDQYGVEIRAGNLQLKFDAEMGELAVWAHDAHKLPVCPLHYAQVLGRSTAALEILGDDFSAICDWKPDVRARSTELKARLARLVKDDQESAEALAAAVSRFNRPDALCGEDLDALIQQQNWRPCHFRVAGDDINYRRFFNVNDLAGIRVELPAVFNHVHRLILDLLKQGRIDGLRVDHIDGLLDPTRYLADLRAAWRSALPEGADDCYVVVEKILARRERLPGKWEVHGTTGYDFCDLALQLLVDQGGEDAFTHGYQSLLGRPTSFAAVLHESKVRVMDHEMAAEMNVLARSAARIARLTPLTADFTSGLLLRAIRALIAHLRVYRTYLHAGDVISAEDLQRISAAVAQARASDRDIDPSVFTFLEDLLTGRLAEPRSGYVRHKVLSCAMRLQQYSGPVMAKGQEDTAYYRYNRLIALNEVGSDPSQFGTGLATWHDAMRERCRDFPHSMLATSTHDSKRGEDARARLAVLSELPDEWFAHVQSWLPMLDGEAGGTAVDPNDIYHFLQLLLGSWPVHLGPDTRDDSPEILDLRERIRAAMLKALREAKVHTNWSRPDESYEAAVLAMVDRSLRPRSSAAFRASFSAFAREIAERGVDNSLAMVALKLTAPGVPDIYQGSERWNFSLVDPDNRRPVDFATLARQLEDLDSIPNDRRLEALRRCRRDWQDGRIKLAITRGLLQLRTADPDLFHEGSYEELEADGRHAGDVCAYARIKGDRFVIAVIGRFPHRRRQRAFSDDTRITLPPGLHRPNLRDVITGRVMRGSDRLDVGHLLGDLPFAVLTPVPPATGASP